MKSISTFNAAITENMECLIIKLCTSFIDLKVGVLLNVASSLDVPFCQPQQLKCLHCGSTKTYLCSPCAPFLLLWLRC